MSRREWCLGACLWWFSVVPGHAHEWYPEACCGGTHCRPAPCEELVEDDKGWIHWGQYHFNPMQIKPSEDNKCHVCTLPTPPVPLCVFVQQGS